MRLCVVRARGCLLFPALYTAERERALSEGAFGEASGKRQEEKTRGGPKGGIRGRQEVEERRRERWDSPTGSSGLPQGTPSLNGRPRVKQRAEARAWLPRLRHHYSGGGSSSSNNNNHRRGRSAVAKSAVAYIPLPAADLVSPPGSLVSSPSGVSPAGVPSAF